MKSIVRANISCVFRICDFKFFHEEVRWIEVRSTFLIISVKAYTLEQCSDKDFLSSVIKQCFKHSSDFPADY